MDFSLTNYLTRSPLPKSITGLAAPQHHELWGHYRKPACVLSLTSHTFTSGGAGLTPMADSTLHTALSLCSHQGAIRSWGQTLKESKRNIFCSYFDSLIVLTQVSNICRITHFKTVCSVCLAVTCTLQFLIVSWRETLQIDKNVSSYHYKYQCSEEAWLKDFLIRRPQNRFFMTENLVCRECPVRKVISILKLRIMFLNSKSGNGVVDKEDETSIFVPMHADVIRCNNHVEDKQSYGPELFIPETKKIF